MDTWKQIVRADVRIVSNAIDRQLCQRILREQKDFKGQPILAEFKLDTEPRMTAKEIAELASSFANAGFEMDAEEVSQIAGFKLRKKSEGGGIGFNAETPPGDTPPTYGGSSLSDPGVVTQAGEGAVVHKADVATEKAENAETSAPSGQPLPQNAGNGPTVAPSAGAEAAQRPQGEAARIARVVDPPERETRPDPSLAAAEKADEVTPQAEAIGERLVRSLQSDFKGVADEIAKVLALPEDKRAGAATELLSRMDSLVPDDPAMAEIIEEQMREAFQQQMAKQPEGDAPAANKAIPN